MRGQYDLAIFDSGIGGLTFLKGTLKRLPHVSVVYLADSLYLPYGNKEAHFVIQRTKNIVTYLQSNYAIKACVVACNTATALALNILRQSFDIPFVGVEPAIKVAAKLTKNKKIGLIATPNTISSKRYESLIEKYSFDNLFLSISCPGLAITIEKSSPHYAERIQLILEQRLTELKEADVDCLVLGCTHYSLIKDYIQAFMGSHVQIIDSQDFVCARIEKVVQDLDLSMNMKEDQRLLFLATDKIDLSDHVKRLVPEGLKVEICTIP